MLAATMFVHCFNTERYLGHRLRYASNPLLSLEDASGIVCSAGYIIGYCQRPGAGVCRLGKADDIDSFDAL